MQNGNQNKKRPNTVEADQLKYQVSAKNGGRISYPNSRIGPLI